jgi:hypothetical protein
MLPNKMKKKLFSKIKYKRSKNRFPSFNNWCKWKLDNGFLNKLYITNKFL